MADELTGRALDARVDALAMGRSDRSVMSVPEYSTDIEAAWEVIERLRRRYTNVTVTAANGWACIAWDILVGGEHVNVVAANGDTAPEAICRCALKAGAARPAAGG